MVSSESGQSLKSITATDLHRQNAELVSQLYGQRIRYHLEKEQVQLDGEPIPTELFYLVLHRDHGLYLSKPMAAQIVLQLAHNNPYPPSTSAPTDPYTCGESVTAMLSSPPPMEISSWFSNWMIQLRAIVGKVSIG